MTPDYLGLVKSSLYGYKALYTSMLNNILSKNILTIEDIYRKLAKQNSLSKNVSLGFFYEI